MLRERELLERVRALVDQVVSGLPTAGEHLVDHRPCAWLDQENSDRLRLLQFRHRLLLADHRGSPFGRSFARDIASRTSK